MPMVELTHLEIAALAGRRSSRGGYFFTVPMSKTTAPLDCVHYLRH